MKRLSIASFFCIATVAEAIAVGRSATPTFVPIVKSVTGGIVMTGSDTGAAQTAAVPATRTLPIALAGSALVMTGQDTGVSDQGTTTARALPLAIAATPGIVMTGQDTGPAPPHIGLPAQRLPLIIAPPSPSPAPTRGIKP